MGVGLKCAIVGLVAITTAWIAPTAVAADKPSNVLTFAKPVIHTKTGTATVTVQVPGPGQLYVTGAGVLRGQSTAAKTVTQAGPIDVLARAIGKAREKLNNHGKVRVVVGFTFAPTGGAGSTYFVRVMLKKRL